MCSKFNQDCAGCLNSPVRSKKAHVEFRKKCQRIFHPPLIHIANPRASSDYHLLRDADIAMISANACLVQEIIPICWVANAKSG